MEKRFRFEDLEIWRNAAQLSGRLFEIADRLEHSKRFRFAEQLRAATLSITNNIAEGSGSTSDVEFAQFLNISRRSTFEAARNRYSWLRSQSYSDQSCIISITPLQRWIL
jgi:four helix bundle protein